MNFRHRTGNSIVIERETIKMERRVLIIDDSEDDILLTKMVLAKIGRSVKADTALNGEAGLALLRGATALPSLILLDLKMPKLNGIEVLRKIRDDERLCRLPVVIVTHSELDSDREASYKAGANCVLHKAVDIDHFRRELEQVMSVWMGSD
jgi:two-component system, response regulator